MPYSENYIKALNKNEYTLFLEDNCMKKKVPKSHGVLLDVNAQELA